MSRRRAVSVPGPTEAELHRFHLFVMTGKDDAGKEKGNARPPAPVSFDAIVRAADNTIVRFDPQLGVTEAELRALRGEREREPTTEPAGRKRTKRSRAKDTIATTSATAVTVDAPPRKRKGARKGDVPEVVVVVGEEPVPKRKRGRTSKTKPVEATVAPTPAALSAPKAPPAPEPATAVPNKRGRPPKTKSTNAPTATPAPPPVPPPAAEPTTATEKRKRGRSSNTAVVIPEPAPATVPATEATTSAVKRKPGRPPKAKPAEVAVVVFPEPEPVSEPAAAKRKPGRPSKAKSTEGPTVVVSAPPPAPAAAPEPEPTTPAGKRKRGRPSKSKPADTPVAVPEPVASLAASPAAAATPTPKKSKKRKQPEQATPAHPEAAGHSNVVVNGHRLQAPVVEVSSPRTAALPKARPKRRQTIAATAPVPAAPAIQSPAPTPRAAARAPSRPRAERRQTIAVGALELPGLSEAQMLQFYTQAAVRTALPPPDTVEVEIKIPARGLRKSSGGKAAKKADARKDVPANTAAAADASTPPVAVEESVERARKRARTSVASPRTNALPAPTSPAAPTVPSPSTQAPAPARRGRPKKSQPAIPQPTPPAAPAVVPTPPLSSAKRTKTVAASPTAPSLTSTTKPRPKIKRSRISELDVFFFHQTHMDGSSDGAGTPGDAGTPIRTTPKQPQAALRDPYPSVASTSPHKLGPTLARAQTRSETPEAPIFPRSHSRTPDDDTRAGVFTRSSSASVSDLLPSSPPFGSEFSFLVASSPTEAVDMNFMRAPAPRWQVASPAVPSVPVFSSVAPGAYMTGRPWARS